MFKFNANMASISSVDLSSNDSVEAYHNVFDAMLDAIGWDENDLLTAINNNWTSSSEAN
jgi:hypothetical protein